MAILSKIRDRSGFLIIAIGLAMFSFVVSPKDIFDFLTSKNVDVIGKVNDEEISHKEFARRVELYKSQSNSPNYGGLAIENMVWNQMVREKIYEIKLKEAGVVIGEGEIWQAIIASQQVLNTPQFKDQQGVFSQDILKNYIADLQNDKTDQGKVRLQGWLNFEKDIKYNLLTQSYNDLVNLGVGATEEEELKNYVLNNTKVSADFVYLPFSTIPNTDVKVTKDDVAAYIKNHENEFQTEAARNLKFVKFSFQASTEDEEEIKLELASLVDGEEGFKKAEDAYLFVDEIGTDLPVVDRFQTESELPTVIKEEVVNGTKGAIVGPYKFSKYYKISKILDVQKIPDSVQSSHILISFVGAQGAQPNVTRTLVDAQKLADSLLTVVKKSPAKFGTLAQNYSSDPGSAVKDGDLGWFGYRSMVPEFRDYCFENKKGDIGVVRTAYGFHVIKIENQKDFNQAYKLATISRKIEASEDTENKVFQNAETFASELRNGADFDKLAKDSGYEVSTVNGIKAMDVYVGALGENRRIVKWSFEEDNDVNTSQRFDLDEKGYAVVMINNKQEKGLKSASNAFSQVEPILIKQKKAEILKGKMQGASLKAIADSNNVTVGSFANVTVGAPTIGGVGTEPAVIGAAVVSKKDALVKEVVGDKGVFAFSVNNVAEAKTEVGALDVKSASKKLKGSVSRQLYEALQEGVTIEDYRAERY
ncbi:peptidylprolyl isomerase [Wenyingzhuangia sp. 2_MG-2023]|nr:peptidylprolyl isomerase [Wenyingzhuangia sp. 2_MG-2023]MDO6737215.1 peptidylprolyl isomerase [Wenyingzhuangia sp. 2_MG-2023]